MCFINKYIAIISMVMWAWFAKIDTKLSSGSPTALVLSIRPSPDHKKLFLQFLDCCYELLSAPELQHFQQIHYWSS